MRAEYSSVHCGTTRPDHDTIATFRRRFAGEIKALFVQVLLIARANRLLKLGNIALDGTRVKANASRHSTEFARLQAGTLRAKLLKIGAVIIRNTRKSLRRCLCR